MQWKTRTVSNAFLSSRIQQVEFYSNNGPKKEINLVITFKKKKRSNGLPKLKLIFSN